MATHIHGGGISVHTKSKLVRGLEKDTLNGKPVLYAVVDGSSELFQRERIIASVPACHHDLTVDNFEQAMAECDFDVYITPLGKLVAVRVEHLTDLTPAKLQRIRNS